jgi:hypothetical protein
MDRPATTEADGAALCLSCALCCDGTLFGGAPLEPDEVEPAVRAGLRVFRSDFEQPCAALRGCSCSIYEARPRACRKFECRLLARGGPLEPRLAVVGRVRELLGRLQELGLSPEDFDGPVAPDAAELHAELMDLLGNFGRAGSSEPRGADPCAPSGRTP